MDAFTTLGIIVSVTAIFAVPIFGIVILIALHLADCKIARSPSINIQVRGDLIVQVDGGERRSLPADHLHALLEDVGAAQTVRVIDPVLRQIEEYRGGRLVRRGELAQAQTAVVRRGQ